MVGSSSILSTTPRRRPSLPLPLLATAAHRSPRDVRSSAAVLQRSDDYKQREGDDLRNDRARSLDDRGGLHDDNSFSADDGRTLSRLYMTGMAVDPRANRQAVAWTAGAKPWLFDGESLAWSPRVKIRPMECGVSDIAPDMPVHSATAEGVLITVAQPTRPPSSAGWGGEGVRRTRQFAHVEHQLTGLSGSAQTAPLSIHMPSAGLTGMGVRACSLPSLPRGACSAHPGEAVRCGDAEDELPATHSAMRGCRLKARRAQTSKHSPPMSQVRDVATAPADTAISSRVYRVTPESELLILAPRRLLAFGEL